MKAVFLVAAVLAVSAAVYFSTRIPTGKATRPQTTAHKAIPSKSLSLPLFFEPNQGQTAPQVKFLARGAGYGLFLTADEAVLKLQSPAVSPQHSGLNAAANKANNKTASASVIHMRLDGANPAATVSGTSPMAGKSNYFIGNDPSKWQRDIPQFARVEYKSVYPGVNLVYYGTQGQLEYDFRVAPGADPNLIALSFDGAAAHIDSGSSGDLVLATANGEVHFHAPRIYQPAQSGAPNSNNASGNADKAITGSFRQLADNKIGFSIGDYDHNRDLVIDPVLTYSTFFGGSLTETAVKVAVDSAQMIYLAGSTDSPDFVTTDGSKLTGTQNIFISKINPLPATGQPELLYLVYLGGTEIDTLSGIAVDTNFSIYVAGTTNSPQFPTTSNAFQTLPSAPGVFHGFVSKISATQNNNTPPTISYNLTYSSYLGGNGTDQITGLAIDATNQNAYVTGTTTSNNPASAGFPANPNGYQLVSNAAPGNPQFFATKINTSGSGFPSIVYSTYFGGGNPAGATAIGGGITVDPTASNVNMYFTGATNMLSTPGPNGEPAFPLFNAQQSCLDESSATHCNLTNPTNTDAFIAKINPNQPASVPVYSTYLGGSGSDVGTAIAVDGTGSAYITGSTNSEDWTCVSCIAGFQSAYAGIQPNSNAFIAKLGGLNTSSQFPLTYFTYIGGSGPDIGQDIKVESTFAVHVTGTTASPNLPLTTDAPFLYGGQGDAFVGLISTTTGGGVVNGNYLTYLGGSQADQGTGIALDIYNAAYVAGTTLSPNFPITSNAYQPTLNANSQDAFVSQIGAVSTLTVSAPTTSPTPKPVQAGSPAIFTFDIANTLGPDNASFVNFFAVVPTTGLAAPVTATVNSGGGNCTAVLTSTIVCTIPSLPVGSTASVQVTVTPTALTTPVPTSISVTGSASANNGPRGQSITQTEAVVDFGITATTNTPSINAGETATIQVTVFPTQPQLGYSATITPSQTTQPAMVTSTTPIFNPTSLTLSGSASATTTLSIATVVRPITSGSLLRRGSFYATWLPIGGLSLVGLGLGSGRKRRRWIVGAVLAIIAGMILLQSGCGSSSTALTPTGGTAAGTYTITVVGSAGATASHTATVNLRVN
jgi:hypothetical protein